MKTHRTARRQATLLTLEIKDIHSADVDDLSRWAPAKAETYVALELTIGEADKEGGDLFQVVVATPEALALQQGEIISNRGLLVVRCFEWEAIETELARIVGTIRVTNWLDASQKLQRYFHWEYEDMR